MSSYMFLQKKMQTLLLTEDLVRIILLFLTFLNCWFFNILKIELIILLIIKWRTFIMFKIYLQLTFNELRKVWFAMLG